MSEPPNETGISIRSGGTGKGLQLRKNVPFQWDPWYISGAWKPSSSRLMQNHLLSEIFLSLFGEGSSLLYTSTKALCTMQPFFQ